MEKEALVEELSKLTVLEMAELKDALEDKWGVKAASAAPAMMMAPAAAEEAAAESTEFEVTLAEYPAPKKIAVIKAVREVSGLGLKEAKELVEGAPKVLKESVSKTEAEEIKKKFEASEAKITIKGL